ncbi:HAD family hydrolase [Amycolatopsis pithecellobii]|uniref:HAD-IIIA family hydrolase n=1 Tax=Amycolatopsis pithecellobii TaxID=664692 RepID=A0A6N7YY99_9PSEU|nr:HAD-IIIA family hydrolase [Amycolatopsis pithecellobii]MTD53873.1 HAD-IIIA family hydrolase [Amycolatopsis pithecellobii]
MSPAAELLAQRRTVLLDFDGPVCAVFGVITDEAVADKLRTLLPGDIPADVATARDPFRVLRYAATLGVDIAAEVEAEFHHEEYRAVSDAPPTTGAFEVLRALDAIGHWVVIVSNNSKGAVRRFLHLHGLASTVAAISARSDADPDHLKPAPYLLLQAMRQLSVTADECVMVGDSVSDIEAAHAAATPAIAYANKPGKRERFQSHSPEAIIDTMTELLPQ